MSLMTQNETMRRLVLPLATALIAGLLIGQIPSAPTAKANAPDRVLSGWMPYWMTSPGRPSGVDSAVANSDLFEDVSPFWYSAVARSGGGIQVRLNPNFTNAAANVAWAMPRFRAAGLTVIPSIADASGRGRMAATLADPASRAAHIADLVALVMDNGYDGLDINYENFAFSDGRATWDATQPNWTAFVAELSAALRAQGKVLSVTIPGPCDTANRCGGRNGYWVYNLPGIAPYADRVRIMAYDFTVQSIGPIAPIGWVRANVQHAVTVMDPAKLQIGVPTYGRARTRTVAGGGFRLSGVCPNKDGSSAERSAWRSATAMSAVTAREIPELLARYGLTDADVTWDPVTQESSFRYTKQVEWTDAAGNRQTCNAERQVNFVGPDAVLARTQLVGEFGLNGAALWTIGGENPAQWAVLRSYAQSLAPAEANIAIDATPAVAFGQPTSVAGGVTVNGAPLSNVPVTLEFQPSGSREWQGLQSANSGPDGAVAFQVVLPGAGRLRLTTADAGAIAASQSAAFDVAVASTVTSRTKAKRVAPGEQIRVRAIVRPAQANQKVVLQVFENEKWRNVTTGRTNAKGRVAIRARAESDEQRWTYRVITRRTGGMSPGISQEFVIRVR